MSRRIIIIVIILSLLIVGFLLGYFIFFSTPQDSSVSEQPELFPNTSGLPSDEPRPARQLEPSSDDFELDQGLVLQQLTDRLVAGSVVFASTTSTGTTTITEHVARFVERGTGHIYEIKIEGGSQKRISNTTVQGATRAFWSADGKQTLIQYGDESGENTYSILTDTKNNHEQLDFDFLPPNTFSPSFSEDGNFLAYSRENGAGKGEVVIYDTKNQENRVVYTSAIKRWLVAWIDSGRLLLQTPPSAFSSGFVYVLETTSSSLIKIVGELPGLSAVHNAQINSTIFSASYQKSSPTSIITPEKEVVPAGIQTIAREKCAASSENSVFFCAGPITPPEGTYPDSWLMGLSSFSDFLWKIDAEAGTVEAILDPPTEVGVDLDFQNLSITSDGKFLLFQNKTDLSLWLVNLEKAAPLN